MLIDGNRLIFYEEVYDLPSFEGLVPPGGVGYDQLPAGGEQGLTALQPGQQLLHLHIKTLHFIWINNSTGLSVSDPDPNPHWIRIQWSPGSTQKRRKIESEDQKKSYKK
jgi:hypothetical protein